MEHQQKQKQKSPISEQVEVAPGHAPNYKGNTCKENQSEKEDDSKSRYSNNQEVTQKEEQSREGQEVIQKEEQSSEGSDSQHVDAKDALDKAKEEIEELKDSWSRERAEFMNFRRRSQQDKEKLSEDTVAHFLQELLPVFDNLDQVLSIKAENEEVKKYVNGIAMIQENFANVLAARNVKILRPKSEAFDPQCMEAISSEEKEGLSEDTVLEVYQVGYLIDRGEQQKRLIRPARVRVGKPPSSKKEK